jgi:hypothetical protein
MKKIILVFVVACSSVGFAQWDDGDGISPRSSKKITAISQTCPTETTNSLPSTLNVFDFWKI